MSGSSHVTPQILGASTVVAVGGAILPETGISLFSSLLIATAAVIMVVLGIRLVKILRAKKA